MLLTTQERYGRLDAGSPFAEDARLTRVAPSSTRSEENLAGQYARGDVFICLDDGGLNHYDVAPAMVARERKDLP